MANLLLTYTRPKLRLSIHCSEDKIYLLNFYFQLVVTLINICPYLRTAGTVIYVLVEIQSRFNQILQNDHPSKAVFFIKDID